MHAYVLMQKYIQMYGNAANFYSGWGERFHIVWIKDNGLHTQRQATKFDEQNGEHVIFEGVVLNMAKYILIMDPTDHMHLLSFTSSHLITKFKMMTRDDCDEVHHSTTTAVAKDFHGGYSVTVTVEENLDKDRLGDAFVLDHMFSSTIVWNYDEKEKQELGG